MSVVTQPEHVVKKNVIVTYHSWSEVAARIEHFIRQGRIKVVESEMPAVLMMFKYIVAFPLGSC